MAFSLNSSSPQECDGARPYCGICTKEILACNYDYDPKVRKSILPKGMACIPCRFVLSSASRRPVQFSVCVPRRDKKVIAARRIFPLLSHVLSSDAMEPNLSARPARSLLKGQTVDTRMFQGFSQREPNLRW